MDRRTLLYSIVLGLLVVALGVVGVLVLRKRAAVVSPTSIQSGTDSQAPRIAPPKKNLPVEPPWQPGQPLPEGNTGPESLENG